MKLFDRSILGRLAVQLSDMRLSRVRPIGIAGLSSLMIIGCGKKDAPQAGPPGGGMPPTAVTAVAAVSRDVPVYIDEIGKADASETVTIQPQVSGKIMSRKFVDGAELHKGELLFEIDPRPFQATLDQANGQLVKDQATKASADWNVSQDQAALQNKAISEQQLHTDVATRDGAVGSIAVDKAMIDSAKLNLEYCTIKSPLDGRASSRLVDVGNVVNGSGQMTGTNLLVINRVDPIYVDFTVTEGELQRVQQFMSEGTLEVQVETPADEAMAAAGEAAALMPPPGAAPGQHAADDHNDKPPTTQPMTPPPFKPRTGKLIFLDNTVQDASGTVKLRAELPNADHHFWPGQFVNVRLILTTKQSVLVPNTATQVSQQGLFVYKVENGQAMLQPVTVGQRHGDMVVIDSGLAAGDEVVTTGQMTLQPGSPVMVVNAGPPGGPPPASAPKAGPGMLKSPDSEGASKTGPSASAGPSSEGSHS